MNKLQIRINRFQFLIVLAGFFQIFSQVFDQFVIQQEQQVRILQYDIDRQKGIWEENSNVNRTYASIYDVISSDTFIQLQIKNNDINDLELKEQLLNKKNILLNKLNLILTNPQIQENIKDKDKYFKYFDNINKILTNTTDIRSAKFQLINDFAWTGLILNDVHEIRWNLEQSINNIENKLLKTVQIKFIILVMGMICNIVSIFFVLIFFYNIVKNESV